MIDILNSDIGTGKTTQVKTKLFIFADFTVADIYGKCMEKLVTDQRYTLIEEKENFDMQGTLVRVITYSFLAGPDDPDELDWLDGSDIDE